MANKFEKIPYSSAKTPDRKTYLYTKGGEYSLDGRNYIGEYHIAGDFVRTGPIPSPESKTLRKYYTNPLLYQYDKSRNFTERVRTEPNQSVVFPKDGDYSTGFFYRYFVERAGAYDGYPIEIDRVQYISYGKTSGIDEGAYNVVKLPWKLTGMENSLYKNGELYIEGIFEHNQRVVYENTRIIPALPSAIRSYTEFARVTLKPTNGK